MSDSIIAALITGAISLTGIVATILIANKKLRNQMEISLAVQSEKIINLKDEVQKHNNFASVVPTLQTNIENMDKYCRERFDKLEKRIENVERS